MNSLLIVTVNFRTADLAIRCIDSVAKQLPDLADTKMHIVDNDSADGSYEKINQAILDNKWDNWVRITRAGKNGGFSFGNNVAVREALNLKQPPDLIWLLNPDAELKSNAATALVDFMQKHPEVGLSTSASEDAHGTNQPMAFRNFGIISEFTRGVRLGFLDKIFPNSVVPMWPKSEPFQADWLSGSSLMIRSEVFDDIGLMDENYFLYFEESDFCLQAKNKGWQLWYVPASRILHIIGASTGFASTGIQQQRRPTYWFDSRRRYFLKNHGKITLILADIAHLMGFGIWRLRQFIQKKPDFDPPSYLSDFFKNSVFIRGLK